ncbi:hypothetical protein F5I97DRAFT_477703 [Phlebopus sp. FC_14]|nr:hypothetical protein F5I97DRAFT_477703 [Phlebopus sp. FC_14]
MFLLVKESCIDTTLAVIAEIMSTTRRVKAMGVWMDPLTTQRSLVHPTLTVEQVVGAVKQDVISNVEKAYGLTLDDTANMDTQYFPHANPSDSVSSFPQLVSLVTPTEAQSRHIKERLSSLQAAEKENQDLKIRNRDLANSLVDTLNTPTGSKSKPKSGKGKGKGKGKEKLQQEEDNDSDSIAELRKMIEQQNAINQEFREDNRRLRGALAKENADQDLKISNRDLANSLVDTPNTPASSTSKPKSGKSKATEKEKPQQEEDNDSDSTTELRKMIEQQNARFEQQDAKLEQQITINHEFREDNRQLREALEQQKTINHEFREDNRQLREALAKEKANHADDIEALRQVTVSLIPLHLRVLLDLGRKKILDILNADSWEDLRGEKNVYHLTDVVMSGLAKVQSRPSRGAISFLCSYNNVRRQGNAAAHTAAEDEIREAVMSKPIDSQDRKFLEQIFSFIFLHPV